MKQSEQNISFMSIKQNLSENGGIITTKSLSSPGPAVLEKRCGIPFWNSDVYINAMGGIRLDEPSVDLAICAALASAANDVPIDKYTALFGEVGLTGEIRPVTYADKRVNECIKTGFKRVILPAKNMKICEKYQDKIELIPVQYVGQMIKALNLRGSN